MDGAVKYVKGDATAGLIITVINIVGGILTGMLMQGMDIMDALQHYTILTIGDGLVSQIPSLMISLATGILVTKGSKDADFGIAGGLNECIFFRKGTYEKKVKFEEVINVILEEIEKFEA